MLPGVWICDEATRILRRRIARRRQLVRGRDWLQSLELPDDERATILSCMREADFLARELAQVDVRSPAFRGRFQFLARLAVFQL
jgi:hypothetical protein